MQQYADIYSLPRHSTRFGCHAPIIRSTKNCICYLWCNVNKGPTRCNSMQIFILCHVTLHVSGVTHPSSEVLKTVSATSGVRHGNGTVTSFQRGLSPDQATEEGSNGTITMTYTRGSRYSF